MLSLCVMNSQKNIQEFDKLLWNTVVNDDEKAFEELFNLFYPPLCVYAKKYIHSQPIREDIVQDVFAALWEDRKKLIIENSVRYYLVVAVKNHCLNHIRKENLNRNYREFVMNRPFAGQEANEIYLLTELYELLDRSLSKLPETYRIVFEMHQLEGKTYEEIALTLNISVRTAKRYKSLVMDVLRKDFKDYLPLLAWLLQHLSN